MAARTQPAGRPEGRLGTVEHVELWWLDLHLPGSHRAGYGVEAERPVVVVRLVAGGVDGWGECAALAAPTYREEHAAGAWLVLRDHLVPRLLGTGLPLDGGPTERLHGAIRAVRSALADVRGNAMAKSALEMAAVDAALRAGGGALADALEIAAARVPAGAVVGCSPDPGRTVAATEAALSLGYRRVKVKIAPGADVGPLGAVRRRWPDLLLQADANARYRVDAATLPVLDAMGLACLEQPLAADDLLGHAALAARMATPLCLDESVARPADVDVVSALGAAAMVCLKAGCLGGIGAALDALRRARAGGLGVWCGGMLQTGLGRAVDAALAGLPDMVLPGDLGGPAATFAEEDPFGPVPFSDGEIAVHRAPGVGPAPDAAVLRSVATDRWPHRHPPPSA